MLTNRHLSRQLSRSRKDGLLVKRFTIDVRRVLNVATRSGDTSGVRTQFHIIPRTRVRLNLISNTTSNDPSTLSPICRTLTDRYTGQISKKNKNAV